MIGNKPVTNQLYVSYNGKSTPIDMEDVLYAIGTGWHSLVKGLITDLFNLGWDGKVIQVKEKFGGLRFYIDDSAYDRKDVSSGGFILTVFPDLRQETVGKSIQDRIYQAETSSYSICEECGKKGGIRSNSGWLKTLCDTCNDVWRSKNGS